MPDDLDRSKRNHPDAFKDYLQPGSGNEEVINLRLDLNLILSTYEDDFDWYNNIEKFYVSNFR